MKRPGDGRRDEGIQTRLPQGPARRQVPLGRLAAKQHAADERSYRVLWPAEWTSSIAKHPAGAPTLPSRQVVRLARVLYPSAATR